MAFKDKKGFSNPNFVDPDEALYNLGQQWIEDFNDNNQGATYAFTEEKAREFSQIPIETLIRDPYFLGFGDQVYDGVLEDIVDLFEERKRREVNLAVFMEGIGAGKTTKASILMWLLWYELSMIPNPQLKYNLAPRSVIALMMFSRSESQSRRITFGETWNRFQSPFNKDYFPPSNQLSREIRISVNNTCVFAGSSNALSALGYNLFGGIIDEAAFLEVVEDSKKTSDEVWDGAEEMYNAVMNRMISRFLYRGKLPGLICMVSSPNRPDDFMHRKIKEAKEMGDKSGIIWKRRSTWEAKGKKYYPQDDHFYINTETSEVIQDENLEKILEVLDDSLFPLEIDFEKFCKLIKYYVPISERKKVTF